MDVQAAKMIGAGIACIALVGAGIGIGNVFGSYLSGALRNPAAAAAQFTNALIGAALAEGLGIFSLVVALLLLFAVTTMVGMSLGKPQGMDRLVYALIFIVLGYLMIVLTGPLVVVRMNNLAWSATAFPGVEIACTMRARTYLRLQTVNVVLTLLTLGLFRPFAAVRTWRYRVAHLSVSAPAGLEQAARMAVPRSTAAGDGVADFLGVDLSW